MKFWPTISQLMPRRLVLKEYLISVYRYFKFKLVVTSTATELACTQPTDLTDLAVVGLSFETKRLKRMKRNSLNCVNVDNNNVEEKRDWGSEDFLKKVQVGVGGFSKVYKASVKGYGKQKVALKVVTKQNLETLKVNPNICAFFQEYTFHKSLQHANVVKALGFYKRACSAVMVMSYCPSDLQDYVTDKTFPLCIQRSLKYIKQIAQAIRYLHVEAQIIHMDLKLENILISAQDIPKITDFGFSIKMSGPRQTFWKSKGGTRWYKPPEQLLHGCFDSTADIWAFGCIAYELLCENHPFFSTELCTTDRNARYVSELDQPTAIARMRDADDGHYRHTHNLLRESSKFRHFVDRVLCFGRRRRATADELVPLLSWLKV